jgi:hypothetical protein
MRLQNTLTYREINQQKIGKTDESRQRGVRPASEKAYSTARFRTPAPGWRRMETVLRRDVHSLARISRIVYNKCRPLDLLNSKVEGSAPEPSCENL